MKTFNVFVRREPEVYFGFMVSALKTCIGSILYYPKDCRIRIREGNHLKVEAM